MSLVVSPKRQEVDASNIDPHSISDMSVETSDYAACMEIMRMMSDEAFEEMIDAVGLMRNSKVSPQSESVEKHEVVTMAGNTPDSIVDIPSSMDPTRMSADKADNSMGAFASRPLKIAEYVWTPSVTFYERFDPWSLFINNKRNVNRFNNFNMFRAKLKVKVLVNGNSFFYGRLMASYQPFETLDSLTANAALVPQDNIQMSQMPRFFIDPTVSQGGEMTLPFFWPYEYCNLPNGDYENLGKMTIRQLTPLKHTSGDVTLSNQINVTVYAWMEDATFEAPTHSNMSTIVPQSEKGDERKNAQKGPVEKVATAVEAAATTLAKIPSIAPFATPAAIGASAIKGVASTMGWCAPTIVEAPSPYKPLPTSNTAVTNGADTSMKLSMDGKNELSVDPRIVGLGDKDELDIRYIASRESYLTSFDWNLTTSAESLLWNSVVDPMLFDNQIVGGKNTHFFTAMAGASLPFKYWNGSISFRFQIVASAFHRGRLAIVYDPDATASTREDNVAYTEVVDISSNRDFTLTIGPNQDRLMIERGDPNAAGLPFSTLGITTNPGYGNGTIAVYVLNELTIPNTDTTVNNDIKVNVFVKANDDFEVFMPSADFAEFVIKPQSETEVIDPVQQGESYETEEKEVAPSKVVSLRNLVYAGEQILSFRQLLKRYYPWRGIHRPTNASSTGPQIYRLEHGAIPGYRGNVPGALDNRAGPVAYSFLTTTMINYLMPAFQAVRGSLRWKIMKRGKGSYDIVPMSASVAYSYDGRYSENLYSITNNSSGCAQNTVSEPGGTYFDHSTLGTVIYAPSVNSAIEYEIPWYTQERFLPGKQDNFTSQVSGALQPRPGVQLHLDDSSSAPSYYQTYVAAGEDFSMYFFTGWPRMYLEVILPASA